MVMVVVVVLLVTLVEVVALTWLGPTGVHVGLGSSSIPGTVIAGCYISRKQNSCLSVCLTCGSPGCRTGGTECDCREGRSTDLRTDHWHQAGTAAGIRPDPGRGSRSPHTGDCSPYQDLTGPHLN